VLLNGRDVESLDAAVASLKREIGVDDRRIARIAFDVTDEAAVRSGIKDAESRFGSIDILVNNAGLQHRAPLEEFPMERWNAVLSTNLTAAFVVAKSVVPGMILRKRGKIINICSLQSELGRRSIAPYAASKGGLKMLTRGMAVEWANHNIQVNAIGPGYFITDMTRPLADDPAFDGWLRGRTPAGRWGNPDELIGTLVYLASDASSFVNGQIIFVDGGILAAI
jgi:gluconate 5-dehydrogenase